MLPTALPCTKRWANKMNEKEVFLRKKRQYFEEQIEGLADNASINAIIFLSRQIDPNSEWRFDMKAKKVVLLTNGYMGESYIRRYEDNIIPAVKYCLKKLLDYILPLCCLYYRCKYLPDGNGGTVRLKSCPICKSDFKKHTKGRDWIEEEFKKHNPDGKSDSGDSNISEEKNSGQESKG